MRRHGKDQLLPGSREHFGFAGRHSCHRDCAECSRFARFTLVIDWYHATAWGMPDVRSSMTPLIVTATLPPDLQAWANRLRQAHYPPERNQLPAHLTLFHALPWRLEEEARGLLATLAASTPPVRARLSGIMDLGSGTALRVECPDLLHLRAEIAHHFHGMLGAQDSHEPRLHVTIQNKVPRNEAKALQQQLAPQFQPRAFAFAGLALHRYLGGPWEPVARWTFRGSDRRRP